jgi:hypothetical protein
MTCLIEDGSNFTEILRGESLGKTKRETTAAVVGIDIMRRNAVGS